MNLVIKPHTILLMVGPSGSGKTTFAKEIIMKQLKDKVRVNYISSDDLRCELAGFDKDSDVNKESNQMLEVSGVAFDLLHAKLNAYTSYPVNSEVVIVDTKGLSETFRQEILEVGKKNNYNVDVVVFNFKKMSDYYKDVQVSKRLVEGNVKRLRQNVLKELSLKKYNNIHSINKKDFKENAEYYKVEIENLEWYKSHNLPVENDYLVVGDIHECLDEFKELLIKNKFKLEGNKIVGHEYGLNKKVVLVGDYVDKGHNTKETIEFMYENKEWIYFVLGNHEDYVYKVLNGEIEEDKITKKKLYYFPSILEFRADEDLKNKFFELVKLARAFYIYKGDKNSSFYVTHVPCNKKYIGKVDSNSLKKQTNIPIDYDLDGQEGFGKSLENQLKYLTNETGMNEPFHIFGHIATKSDYSVGNKLGIDTGSVFGNKLTGVSIGQGKAYYYSTKSSREVTCELPEIFKRVQKDVNLSMLDKYETKKLYYAAHNNVNFISGTMSPSDKDMDKKELESLDKGLDYFKYRGVNRVILQPKYMGSRCNIYLNIDVSKSYAVSRNGFIIKNVDLSKVFEKMHNKYEKDMLDKNLEFMILDGELLPWNVLGEGLIEGSFKPLERLARAELDLLGEYNFEENYIDVKTKFDSSDFVYDKNNITKKELMEKYGGRDYETFKNLVGGQNHHSLKVLNELLDVYNQQVDIFGTTDNEPYFEAFNILKMVDVEGNNVFYEGNNEEVFNYISDSEYVVVDLNSEEGYRKAREFYDMLTVERFMEGVVIKPLVNKEDLVPFMKVRNKSYLTLVYGYDYLIPEKFEKLLNQKNISRKLRTSLKEHVLGEKLLDIPYGEIDKDNKEFLQLVANILLEVRSEANIDPRL